MTCFQHSDIKINFQRWSGISNHCVSRAQAQTLKQTFSWVQTQLLFSGLLWKVQWGPNLCNYRTGWSFLETTFYSKFTLWQATQIHQTLFLFSFFAGLSQFHLRFFWPFLLLPLLQSSYSLLDSCNATTRNCVLIFTLGVQYKFKTSLLSETDFRVIGRIHSGLFFYWSEIFEGV